MSQRFATTVIEEAGYKENVIPSTAELRVNCRGIPGGKKPREFLPAVRELLADRDVEVALVAPDGVSEEEQLADLDEAWATPPADLDTDLYRSMESATEKVYDGTPFAPALFEAGTSLARGGRKGSPATACTRTC